MKGIVLAGGTGTRLYPLTKAINKHLLPVGRFPMIYYPLYKLHESNINEVMVVTGREHIGDFARLLGNGQDFGMRLTYMVQENAGGISDALQLAESFAGGEKVVVLLGDNVCELPLLPYVNEFRQQNLGARVLLKDVPGAEKHEMAVAEFHQGNITVIQEKPQYTTSNLCVTGYYMYDGQVFDLIRTLKPSARGELEITDLNLLYLRKKQLSYNILPGWWGDAGTKDSLEFIAQQLRSSPTLLVKMDNFFSKGV